MTSPGQPLIPFGTSGYSKGYTPLQTGAPSRYGYTPATTGTSRRLLNPWGNNYDKASARGANGVGQTSYRPTVAGSARKMPTPDSQIFSMDYTPNLPGEWPIAGGKRVIWDQAGKATRHNAQPDYAFTRLGYGYTAPITIDTSFG